jgi:flagellar basal body-associated protein FliL
LDKSKLLSIVIIALLVVLIGAVGTALFFGYRYLKPLSAGEQNLTQNSGAESDVALKLEEIDKVPLSSEITTNLMTGDDGVEHYVKVQLTIGVNNTDKKKSPGIVESLAANESVTRDIVLSVLHNHTYEDLRTPSGQELLKDNIKARLREEYDTYLICQVYISDLVLS